MDGQTLRLHGAVVTLPHTRLQVKLWTYSSDTLYGVDLHDSQGWKMDISTGIVQAVSSTEQLVFARGDDFDAVEFRQSIIYNYDDFATYAQQMKELDKRKQAQMVINFFRGRWNLSPEASKAQEQFILMLAQGQADDKDLWKGYKALGGSLDPKFRKEKQGGYSFGDFSLDYLLDDLKQR